MILNIIVVIMVGVFAFLILVVFGILFAPVRVSMEFNTADKPLFCLKVVFFDGLWPIASTHTPSKPVSGKRRSPRKKEANPSKSKIGIARVYRIVAAVPALAANIMARVKIETLNARIAFGLPNPADTGALYGMLAPLTILAEQHKVRCFSVLPNFRNEMFEGRFWIVAQFTPVKLIPSLLRFFWVVFISSRSANQSR